MTRKEFKELLKKDKNRWDGNHFFLLLRHREYRLVYRYRKCQFYEKKKLLVIIYQIQRFLFNKLCNKCGCDIPSHVSIGGGFKLVHTFGIVINSKAVIGENFTIKSGSVIGLGKNGVPTIGNNVTCNVHAILIGGIHIGDGAEIGAGAIVTHDVPENGVVIGDAAHILKIKNDIQKRNK